MKSTALNEKQQETLTNAQAEIERRGLTQGAAAKEMGISPAALNQLFKGAYNADPSNQLEKIEKWLQAQADAQEQANKLPVVAEWVPTPTGERVKAALGYAHLMSDFSLIYGGAGVGKTATAKEYARQFPNVWIATMNTATSGVVPSLEEIHIALGFKLGLSVSAARLHRDVCRKIQGSSGLLIIDEAQHLDTQALDSIRAIHDATGVGIALMGNESIYTRMTGGNRAAYLDRLFSRIGKKVKVQKAQAADVTAIAGLFGIEDKKALAMLKELGGRAGALRSVSKTLRLATMMAGGTVPDAAQIQAAWKDLSE